MRKYIWIVVGLGTVLLLLLGSFYLYWYARSTNSQRKIVRSAPTNEEVLYAPPAELTTGYDPAQNAGQYSVEEVDIASGQVKLKYVYPHVVVGQLISPVLSCQTWDSKVFDLGKKVPRYVSRETLLRVMAETPKNQLMLSGKCSDRTCTTMDRECQLFITWAKQNETE